MITIKIGKLEYYDDARNEFIIYPQREVDFEYSLAVVAKWEAKWKIPFLTAEFEKVDPKLMDFYLMMSKDPTLTDNYITDEVSAKLADYIADSFTATTFSSSQNGNKSIQKRGKQYSAEEIYALMFMNSVPLEFEERNLNRLLVILRVISVYASPPTKMTQEEIMAQRKMLNAERKKKYNTKG